MFVAVLGRLELHGGACWMQALPDWIDAPVRALEAVSGFRVYWFLPIPTAVIKALRNRPVTLSIN